jgi:hypothetical protein
MLQAVAHYTTVRMGAGRMINRRDLPPSNVRRPASARTQLFKKFRRKIKSRQNLSNPQIYEERPIQEDQIQVQKSSPDSPNLQYSLWSAAVKI